MRKREEKKRARKEGTGKRGKEEKRKEREISGKTRKARGTACS